MRGFYCIIICSFLISFLILGAGCDYRVVKDPNALNGTNGKQTKPIDETSVVEASLVRNNILNSCMSCHVGSKQPELGSISAIQQNISQVITAVNSNSMPPEKSGYVPLPDCDKAVLIKWAQLGVPETSTVKVGDLPECKGVVVTPPPPEIPIGNMPVTYQTLLTKILQPKCLNCHNPDSDDVEAAGILFYPYSEITKRPRLWSSPGAKSKIVRVLTKTTEDRMPPPEDGNPLSAEEIQFIIKWLDSGAPQ